jgi:vitamin B12 transporter
MNKQKQSKSTSLKAFRFKRFARKSYSVFNSLHKVVSIGVLSGCALMNAHSASVNPVERTRIETSTDSTLLRELDEVVVTASKTELPLSRAAKQVIVITQKDIEAAPVRSTEDLLNYVAGVDVLQRGPHGVQADISLRGGSFDQTAILLNGINLTNPQTGHYSFDIPLNLSDIERIEIIQGPASLAYGAGAFAGGINIITKKDTLSNAYVKTEGGMYGLFGAEARGAMRTPSAVHQLSAGYDRSDGYIANSDYRISNMLWQSRFDIKNSTLDLQLGYNDKDYGANTFYTAAYPNQFDDTETIFASIKGETNGQLKVIPVLYWNRHYDCFQLFRDGTSNIPDWYKGHNYHRSDVFGANLNMQYASAWGITSFGGEFRNESILSNVLGKPMDEPIGKYTKSDSRTNISYFAEHNFVTDKFTLSLGGLLNHNTAIADKFTFYPAVNASFRPTPSVSIYASWNKATRMPTFTELYYTTATHTGNTDLEAERSQAWETGIKFRNRIVSAEASAFYMRGDSLIDWVKPDPDALWESRNHSRINKKGVETNLSLDLQEWFGNHQPFKNFRAGYTYLHQNLVEDELISNYTLNHLRHKFTATLYHEIVKNLSVSWNFRWQDRIGSYVRYVDGKPGEKTAYKPFSVLDVKVDYAMKHFRFFANANNIFDTSFIDFGNVPQPGFWFTAGVSYTTR